MEGFDHSNMLREDAAQIVADRRTNLQEDGVSNRIQGRTQARMRAVSSALMAIGALLGVKIFRRDAKHVVTLNANTVKHRFSRRRSFMFRGVRSGLSGFICHK
jgi:hypothetical protein